MTIPTSSATSTRPAAGSGGIQGIKRRRRADLIVDDHPIIRQGLRRVMDNEEDLSVCGEAESVRAARTHHPQLPIRVLSMHDETIYAERRLAAGANGYIMIQKFAAGGSYISANPIERLSNGEAEATEA